MDVKSLGWNGFFEKSFRTYQQKGLQAGRVISQRNGSYVITTADGTSRLAKITWKFRYKTQLSRDFPVVGDWVAFETKPNSIHLLIHTVLPRENAFVRKQTVSGGRRVTNGRIEGGKTEEQVIASNINTAFIVMGLDNNFIISRIERFLTLAYNSGIEPVIILNKADLCSSINEYLGQVKNVAPKVPVYFISAEKGINMNVFQPYLSHGRTVVFLGSSGVGKSTITNYLMGHERQMTKTVSKSTGKGRHTTTNVELIFHPSNGMIIDTPGVKELQLWGDEEVLDHSFEDIKELVSNCKFNNCQHQKEPGCAIQMAIQENKLSKSRFNSYQEQLAELKRLKTKRRDFDRKINTFKRNK